MSYRSHMGTSRAPTGYFQPVASGYQGDKGELQPPANTVPATLVNTGAPGDDSRAAAEDLRETTGIARATVSAGGYTAGSAEAVAVIPSSTKPLKVNIREVGQAAPSAPEHFQLATVVQDMAPPPKPAPTLEQMPRLEAMDRQVLQSVDDHAIQVSKSDHRNFRDLVWDLIYSKDITDEMEKVRAIFRWLATKNLKEMTFDKVEKDSPEEILMELKSGKTTYSKIFHTMCSYAGLHSMVITGYAKGSEYLPGMKFAPGQYEHSWNAVHIYCTWCLVDVRWAARSRPRGTLSADDLHYELLEFFFLTDPQQLIYSHFPMDSDWQLLERPVTIEEFENMPHVKPKFFKYDLELITHHTAVIHSHGDVHVRLRYPAHKVAVAFSFTVEFEDGSDAYKGTELNRYGLHECADDVASFSLRLPVSGFYLLSIYAKDDTPETSENVFSEVCEYKVQHKALDGSVADPYPPCTSTVWGPGSSFYKYGLSTSQQSSCIVTQGGKAELQVQQQRPIQFMAQLKHNKISDSDLESFVMHRVVGNTVYFDITVPGRGEYCLKIFAKDPAKDGQKVCHSAQFLVVCQEDVKATPLPKLPPGYLGPQPKFSEFGMVAASHQDPLLHLDCNTVTVVLKCQQPMRILAKLISVDGDQDLSDFTFSNTVGLTVSLLVHLPRAGFFKLQIYGVHVSSASQELPNIYNYLINSQQALTPVFPFPKQYTQWREGCSMPEIVIIPSARGPFGGQAQMDRLPDSINFKVMIPKAKAVAMVAGQDWMHFERGNGDEWSGQVKVGHLLGSNNKMTLRANFGGDKTSYATLLKYTL